MCVCKLIDVVDDDNDDDDDDDLDITNAQIRSDVLRI